MNRPVAAGDREMTEKPTKTVLKDGTVEYRDSAGRFHREDGPAREWANGSKEWCLHGERHREDGPAVEWADGFNKWWYLHEKLHREDGPAIEGADGFKSWWLHGIQVNEETYERVLSCPFEELPEYLETEYEALVMKRLATA